MQLLPTRRQRMRRPLTGQQQRLLMGQLRLQHQPMPPQQMQLLAMQQPLTHNQWMQPPLTGHLQMRHPRMQPLLTRHQRMRHQRMQPPLMQPLPMQPQPKRRLQVRQSMKRPWWKCRDSAAVHKLRLPAPRHVMARAAACRSVATTYLSSPVNREVLTDLHWRGLLTLLLPLFLIPAVIPLCRSNPCSSLPSCCYYCCLHIHPFLPRPVSLRSKAEPPPNPFLGSHHYVHPCFDSLLQRFVPVPRFRERPLPTASTHVVLM